MNLSQNPALIEQLAASYALGTLRGGARRKFEELARNQPVVRASALIWQGRLASMAELEPEIAPGPAVWKRIENLVNADKESKIMQAARSTAVAQSTHWWGSLSLWRAMTGAGAMAAVAAVVVGANLHSLNASLGGQVQELSAKLLATPVIQYVAVLSDDKSTASMLVTFDPKTQKLLLKRVGDFQEQPGKSLQLWALPKKGGPQSLGVLGGEAVIRLTAAGSDVKDVPTLAISLEPKGGVSSGRGPTGPVLFKGALIETAL